VKKNVNKKRTELNLSNTNQPKFTKKYTLPFILITLALILSLGLGTVSAADWTVGPGGTYNYTSIQDAINNESTLSGDTISVYDDGGSAYTYNENVVVNKTNLTVQSTGQVTVSGSSASSPVITVNSQGSYSSIIGFILTGATNSAGVRVTGTNNVSITNLTINNCQRGVQMTGTSTNITVDGATINAPTAQGIYIDGTQNNITINNTQINNPQNNGIEKYGPSNLDGIIITNTTITQPTGHGIILEDYDYYDTYLKNITINNVTITRATQEGIHITMDDANSANTTITNNNLTGSTGTGLYANLRGNVLIEDNNISNNKGWGMHLLGYNNPSTTINNNRVENNINGIYIQDISGTVFDVNVFNNGGTVFQLENADNTTIENLTFNNNIRAYNYAIYASNSDNLTLKNLNITNNSAQAIWLGTSINTIINNVNITNSTQQAIYLTGSLTNVTINNTQITDTKSASAIEKDYWSSINGITITKTTITNPNGYGIALTEDYYSLTNILIDSVTITQAHNHGIYIHTGNTNSQNLTITNTTSNNNSGCGALLRIRGNITITNNTLQNNGDWGLWLQGYNTPNTTLQNNTITQNGNGIYIQDINGLTLNDTNNIHDNGGTICRLENSDNTTIENITFNNGVRAYNYAIYASNSDNLTLKNLNITNNSAQAIWLGTSINTIINNVNITNSTQQAIYLTGSLTNVTINNTQITDTKSASAIEKDYWSSINGITITKTTITNPNGYGIALTEDYYSLTNILIDSVTITQAHNHGIYIHTGNTNSQNLTITNTTSNNNSGCGALLRIRGNITITNNTLQNNGDWGVNLFGLDNPAMTLNNNNISGNANGLYLENIKEGNFQDNQLINNTGDDLYATVDTNNTFTRLTIGLAHPTTMTITYINGIIVNGVKAVPADPTGWVNIGKYVDLQGLGSTELNLTMFYNTTDVSNVYEDGLKICHYDGSNWSLVAGSGVNTVDQYVYANDINSFSTFAALAEKLSTTIELPDVTGYRNEDKTISATLKDSNGNAVAGREIKFFVDGTEVGSATANASGVASIIYSLSETAGTYTLNASFAGDDAYNASANNTATLIVNKRPITLTVNNTSGINGQDVRLAARLTTEGVAVSGATIQFTVNGTNAGSATTGTDGWATLTYSIILTPGSYNIQAEFTETPYYLGNSTTGTLTVYKNNTNILVTDATGINGQNVQLLATLTNQNGTPLTGKTVNFTVNGAYVGSAVTVNNGVVTLTYIITQTPGIYIINAAFNGDNDYNASAEAGTLTVYKKATTLAVADVAGTKGHNVNLQATLTSQSTAVAGKTIQFTVNGANVGSAVADSNGVATLTHTITENQGTYTIGAIFTEDGDYNGTTGSGTLTVEDKTTNLAVPDVNGKNGSQVDLNATLTDRDGNPLTGQTIYFRVDGTLVGNADTNSNGIATVPYTIDLTGGTHTIQADFMGTENYQATTGTGELKVPLASLYITTSSSKNNPTVGEIIVLTFKVGNNGPDTAENVTFTLVIPEGMEFINTTTDQGNFTYNATTRTITWNLGNVTVGDPYLWANVKVLNTGNYLLRPHLTTDTYDSSLDHDIQSLTLNVQAASQKSDVVVNGPTVGMQTTGAPIGLLLLVVLMLLGGIIVPKRK